MEYPKSEKPDEAAVEEAKVAKPKPKVAKPKKLKLKAAEATVECTVNNVWTSKGKLLKGEKAEVSKEEAELLVSKKMAKKVSS